MLFPATVNYELYCTVDWRDELESCIEVDTNVYMEFIKLSPGLDRVTR